MDKNTVEALQAANVLCSHLTASGISATKDGAIVTINYAERQHTICVGTGYDLSKGQLDISDLRSNRPQRLNAAMDKLKELTGIDAAINVTHRAPQDKWKKGTLKENFEAVLFREKTFRNAPNPDPAKYKSFEPIAIKQAKKIFFKYRQHMLSFGYESEDFQTVARVHLVTFLHRYQTGDQAEDEKNLNRYMKQRMTEVVYKIMRKSDQCCSDLNGRTDIDVETNLKRLDSHQD